MRKKAIDDTGVGHSGGSKAIDKAASKVAKGRMAPGPGRDRQNPAAQRNRDTLEAWCQGKSESYK